MQVNIVGKYKIFAVEIQDSTTDAGKMFMDKWKGPACENFKKHRAHKSLIPQSIVGFMKSMVTEIISPID
jgi:hypothetical protein